MDEELAALERAVARGGTDARLRYARALERLGRRDEALDALLPARASEDVRVRIATFPRATWSSAERVGFGTFPIDIRVATADVAPFDAAPALGWHRPELAPFDAEMHFAVHPLGVVLQVRGAPVQVLDLITGEGLWSHAWSDHVDPHATDLHVSLSERGRSPLGRRGAGRARRVDG